MTTMRGYISATVSAEMVYRWEHGLEFLAAMQREADRKFGEGGAPVPMELKIAEQVPAGWRVLFVTIEMPS